MVDLHVGLTCAYRMPLHDLETNRLNLFYRRGKGLVTAKLSRAMICMKQDPNRCKLREHQIRSDHDSQERQMRDLEGYIRIDDLQLRLMIINTEVLEARRQ